MSITRTIIHAALYVVLAVATLTGCSSGSSEAVSENGSTTVGPSSIPTTGSALPRDSIFGVSTFGTDNWSK